MKMCSRNKKGLCEQVNPQPLENFGIKISRKDGLQGNCKSCVSILAKNYGSKYRRTGKGKYSHRKPYERFRRGKYSAQIRDLSWELTFEQWQNIIAENKCHYCDNELPTTGCALDRKDNEFGYLTTNVVACCTSCNAFKGNHVNHLEMVAIMKLLKCMRLSTSTATLLQEG